MLLRPGTRIERFTVRGLLGRGGMAEVYLARHVQLGTLHAIKVLMVASETLVERLVREGRIQASLRHPNIVAVTGVVDVSGSATSRDPSSAPE